MLQGIKEAAADMSPYVRKTAAHAIPKLAETDESCHDELIEIISRLLGDKELITTLYFAGLPRSPQPVRDQRTLK